MIKINKQDLRSINWAIYTLEGLAKQSLSADYKKLSGCNCKKLRKIHIILMNCISQPHLEFERTLNTGIPTDSKLGKGIKALTDEVPLVSIGHKKYGV